MRRRSCGGRGLTSSFVDLGPVSDPERRWLYGNAALVLFPTLYEGFGLVPFEAAAAGTACVYSSRSSVGEYLPDQGALLDLGDPGGTARRLKCCSIALTPAQRSSSDPSRRAFAHLALRGRTVR